MSMTRISEVLKESKATQITGDLVKTMDEDYHDPNKKIMGYCAIGVLACNKHKFTTYGKFKTWYAKLAKKFFDSEKPITERYNYILREYKVPEDLINIDYGEEFNLPFGASSLSVLIYELNDSLKMSFKEIGEFLEICLDL